MAVTYVLLLKLFTSEESGAPSAKRGVLDLTEWSFAGDGPVMLQGEWEFYPGELVDPGAAAQAATASGPEWIDVPGTWLHRMNAIGRATYRLRIELDGREANRTFGLKTSSIQLAGRIVVNGEVVGENGSVDKPYVGKNKPFVSYFRLRPGTNEILVHAANLEFPPSSGIKQHIAFGYSSDIAGLRDQGIAYDWISFTSFLIMGLYFIGLYTQRREDFSLLAFGSFCVLIAVYTSTSGERIIYSLFDGMPFWLFVRVQLMSAVAAGVSMLLYLLFAFRPYCPQRFAYASLGAGATLFLIAAGPLTGFLELGPNTLILFTGYATFPLVYGTYVFVSAALDKVEGSVYLVVAALALNGYALLQNLKVYTALEHSFIPFEPFLFLLMIALLMSLRFSNAFRKVEELTGSLIKMDELKDDFLARTSHEFKTPLHGVMNIAQSMLDDENEPLTAGQQGKLRLLAGIAGRLTQLVYDILDLSKLKQGQLTVQPVAVDVRSAVEVNLRIYSYLLKDKRIDFVNRVPGELPFALADEVRFNQIIGNLIDNAVKYTEQGSIEVSAEAREDRIAISVKDTGTGMSEERRRAAFEPFVSFGGREAHSVGLGLPIVRQLLELQNGDISIASREGEGTEVTVLLPTADSARTGKPSAEPQGVGVSPGGKLHPMEDYSFKTPFYSDGPGHHTVLIVDDHFPNLTIMMDAIRPLGCDVIAVKNGYEALEQIGSNRAIDLVVLDLMMPGLSGTEVCQTIRRSFTLLELPVLMVTAAFQAQDKLAAFVAGANDFLPKPFDLAELKARVKCLLDMKQSLGTAIEMEMAFLQSQIKPHFLYNVLNSIVALSYTNLESSRKLTTDLADYLRGSFRFSNTHRRVPFRQELEFVRTYVSIEQARFKERLRMEYEIGDKLSEIGVPPLLLQPLVENAIRHGIGGRIEGGAVKLTAKETQGAYVFSVEDDGCGMTEEALEELKGRLNEQGGEAPLGVGLRNIHKRLKYEYGSELRLESAPDAGTTVTVVIPKQ
ncbi:ATP-binding protein [Cohnella cellulosilytica]|uniref:histidine kinase n=1 Tax=Cohnella cellulosilytica TaxID=986710 RepID=A0ABW2FCS1_9BACL